MIIAPKSVQTERFPYADVQQRADQDPNVADCVAIAQYLRQMHAEAHQRATKAQQDLSSQRTGAVAQGKRGRSPSDPNVAKMRYTATLYQKALAIAEKVVREITMAVDPFLDADAWAELADHHVLTCPWGGMLSLIDLIHLTEGTPTRRRGLQTLDLPGYARPMPHWDGWHILFLTEFGEEDIPVTAEGLHRLLVEHTFAQEAPFDNKCVLPTTSWSATFDGMTVAITQDSECPTRDHDVITVPRGTRISLYRHHYVSLVWSVGAARYPEQKDALARQGKTTALCFGGNANHIPENLAEVEFWHANYWWREKTPQEQENFFKPGWLLSFCTPADMDNLDAFTVAYRRKKEQEAVTEQERRLKREQVVQTQDQQPVATIVAPPVVYDSLDEEPF